MLTAIETMLPLLNLPVAVDGVVGERGGPWDVTELRPERFPALQTTLPMQIVYQRVDGDWVAHLLIAESAILHRTGAPHGMGVYALRRFRGPREVKSALGGKREPGEEIGWYGGAIVDTAPTQAEAEKRASTLAREGRQSLLAMRVTGRGGWVVVDGEEAPARPYLHKVNDPRGTRLEARCEVSEFGCFRAARDIPALDWTRPLRQQIACELSFDYGEFYWELHRRLGSADVPLVFERSAHWATTPTPS